jgi:hypothetical protein
MCRTISNHDQPKGICPWLSCPGQVFLLVVLLCGGLSRPLQAADEAVAEQPEVFEFTPAKLEASIGKGISFLLERQNKNGSWGSARNTKGLNIYAPIPGAHHAFRSGVTAMCVSALIESDAQATDERVAPALERAEAWLLEYLPQLRRAHPRALYNVWGHGYGIQALVNLHRYREGNEAKQTLIKQTITGQLDLLRRYESVDGGWGYYDFKAFAKKPSSFSTSFVTATVLVAMHEARSIGIEVPQDLIKRGIASMLLQRKSDNTYTYSLDHRMSPMRGINRPGGSLGRSQACNVALRLWDAGNITDEILTTWLERLVARNGWLDIGRKRPVPHEAWFQVAGYFFYYGHYYAALCIEQLPGQDRPKFQQDLAELLIPLQELDGSWWDFPFYDYHQPYGTAFALMSLARCRTSQ